MRKMFNTNQFDKMKNRIAKLMFLLVTASLSIALQAQETSASRQRFGRMSVVTSTRTAILFTDTLDTGKPGVRVVLYGDGTFRYLKDRMADTGSGVFSECWDTLSVNPYSGDPAPDSFSLWVVDTLDSYCCPYRAAPSSPFGLRNGRRHQGVDIPCYKGMPVLAAFDGKVRVSASVSGYGELVIIRHPNGLETFYAHLSRRDVSSGDWVRAGDVVGRCGSTGRSSGAQLHFETRYRGFAFDPSILIDFESGILRHRLLHVRSSNFDPDNRHDKSLAGGVCTCCREGEERHEDYYTVRSGDTLARIARKNGTSVRDICRLNGIKETTALRVGQRLKVK